MNQSLLCHLGFLNRISLLIGLIKPFTPPEAEQSNKPEALCGVKREPILPGQIRLSSNQSQAWTQGCICLQQTVKPAQLVEGRTRTQFWAQDQHSINT